MGRGQLPGQAFWVVPLLPSNKLFEEEMIMSNDNVVELEEFEGLKCSRPNCGGPADVELSEESDVVITCRHCTNSQTVYSAPEPEEDSALFDAVQAYILALDSPRYSASHTQSVEKALTDLRQVFLNAS